MRNNKRWLKQVIREASDKHYEMPWKQDARPAAFSNPDKSYEYTKTA
ncbi:MAG: hypothetical protein QM492_12540 [Rhodobacterales bacterium]